MKNNKILILVLILALIIVGLLIRDNDELGKPENNVTQNKVQQVENKVTNKIENKVENTEKNEVNNKVENVVENTVANNVVENKVQNEVIENTTTEETTTSQPPKQDNDQKAINMVKQDWGEDSSVTFKIDEKKENGKYVVSVVDKNTTAVLVWYDVDVENNTIQVR